MNCTRPTCFFTENHSDETRQWQSLSRNEQVKVTNVVEQALQCKCNQLYYKSPNLWSIRVYFLLKIFPLPLAKNCSPPRRILSIFNQLRPRKQIERITTILPQTSCVRFYWLKTTLLRQRYLSSFHIFIVVTSNLFFLQYKKTFLQSFCALSHWK